MGDIDKVKSCLDKISVAGDHITGLINNILDITRIEQGRALIKERMFDISEMTDELKYMLEPLASEKSIVLRISDKDVVNRTVVGDYKSCHAGDDESSRPNAIKYTPAWRICRNQGDRAPEQRSRHGDIRFYLSGQRDRDASGISRQDI